MVELLISALEVFHLPCPLAVIVLRFPQCWNPATFVVPKPERAIRLSGEYPEIVLSDHERDWGFLQARREVLWELMALHHRQSTKCTGPS